jgi:hypothetical protein
MAWQMERRRRFGGRAVAVASGGSGPGYLFDPTAPDDPPLRDQLAVFSRTRRPDDDLPVALLRQIKGSPLFGDGEAGGGVSVPQLPLVYRLPLPGRAGRLEQAKARLAALDEFRARAHAERGSPVPEQSRLLAGPVGVRGHRLFAVPTTKGQVAFFAIETNQEGGSGSTAWVLDQGVTWHTSWNRTPEGSVDLLAFGLLSDDVARVEVRVNDANHEAAVGENGFLFETRTQDPDDVTAFEIFYSDGTRRQQSA